MKPSAYVPKIESHMIIDALQRLTPQKIRDLTPQFLVDMMGTQPRVESLPSYSFVEQLMTRYQTGALVDIDQESFRRKIDEFLKLQDYAMEGYQDAEMQRDISIKFHWGHDHDFGDFQLKGKVGRSHIGLIASFLDLFAGLPKSLEGQRILDIGCWTGGTSLLLAAMGATVVAVEEVKKYVDCLTYLKDAFAIEGLEPKHLSLYDCTAEEFQDSFDYVLFAGVLYHVTDPILALRITYNCLKDGGKCLLETAIHDATGPHLAYHGPRVTIGGSKGELNRSGWNWFLPTPETLSLMMEDVGYSNLELGRVHRARREFGPSGTRIKIVGERKQHKDMLRSGLSVRNVR